MQNLSNVSNYHLQRYNFVSKYHIQKVCLSQNDRYGNWTTCPLAKKRTIGIKIHLTSHHTASTTCATNIAGTPYLNFLCCVLWRQTCIPNHAPTLPPTAANPSKTLSGMRHRLCCAFHLSMPYAKKATTLMMAK